MQVKHADYALPNPALIDRLQPGNYEVEAYSLPDADGMIAEVYVYQNNQYLCKCERVTEYSTAKAEWVAGQDEVAYTNQAKYVSAFDKKVKAGKLGLSKIEILKPEVMAEIMSMEPVIVQSEPDAIDNLQNLLDSYNPQDYLDQADENL